MEGYAAAFMFDWWYRLHEIMGDETYLAYQSVSDLRRRYGQYEKRSSDIIKGDPIPPGSLALLHLPHRKGTTPFRGRQAAASELAESNRGSLTFWSWGRSLETGDLLTGIRERASVSDHWKDERKVAEAGYEQKSKTAYHLRGQGKRRHNTPRAPQGVQASPRGAP